MRGKIIAVFAVVVLVVGGLSYALTRAVVSDTAAPAEAPRALAAGGAQLQVDALMLERWLAAQAGAPRVREPFNAGTAPARAEAATNVANALRDAAASAPELASTPPALVVLLDKDGAVLGRNGSALMRGDDLGKVYPALKDALAKGVTGSDVWVSRERSEQLLASYAPVRGADGQVIGGVAIGTALNNERLTKTSNRTSGHMLIVAVQRGDALDVVARTNDAPQGLVDAVIAPASKEALIRAVGASQIADLPGLPKEFKGSGQGLEGYGDGKRALLVAVVRSASPDVIASLVWPALGVTALGLILVMIGGYFLDTYISTPISEIEEGLLAIINGRTDLRFEIEHAELGGLVFRLNSLLNQLTGGEEEETDAEGRPSRAPRANAFEDALAVDERMASLSSAEIEDARSLREEPDDAYYDRIYREYIRAKTTLGDPVDHITREDFVGRIMSSERETAHKHGKPVRYKVEVRGKEVVLLAVPLS